MELVALDGRAERRTALAPIGEELRERPRLDHGARDDVRADGRALLDDRDRRRGAGLPRELTEPAAGREARRSGADDNHVELERLSRHRYAAGNAGMGERAGIVTSGPHSKLRAKNP